MLAPEFAWESWYFRLSRQAQNPGSLDWRVEVSFFDYILKRDVFERVMFNSFSSQDFFDHDSIIIYQDDVVSASMTNSSRNDRFDDRAPD